MRFCVSLYFQILVIYCVELYPVQVASLGLGANNLIGTVATLLITPMIGYLNKTNFSIMIVFTVFAFLIILATAPLK